MVDGIKIENLWVSANLLFQTSLLDFLGKYSYSSGEILKVGKDSVRIAKYRALIFTAIRRKKTDNWRVELRGSLHKFHNNGVHNANDFTVSDLYPTVSELTNSFEINPFGSRLNNVEFGVNITLPFPAQHVIDSLIAHKGVPFQNGPEGPIYRQCKHQQYIIKIYNKGRQYNLGENLLRIEVKVMKMEFLTRQQINLLTLADLLNPSMYSPLGKLLHKIFSEIIFDEPTIKANSSRIISVQKEREFYYRCRNADHWKNKVSTTENRYDRERMQLNRDEKKFRDLLDHYRQGENWQQTTADLIQQKWQYLTAVDSDLLSEIENRLSVWRKDFQAQQVDVQPANGCSVLTEVANLGCSVLTGLENEQTFGFDHNSLKSFPINISSVNNTVYEDSKGGASQGTKPEGNHEYRICPVTGFDISKQPAGSTFLTAKTVRKLYDEDRLIFQELAVQYLTDRQKVKPNPDRWAYFIAHNIRNRATNGRNKLRDRIRKMLTIPCLFPPDQLYQLSPERVALLQCWEGTRYEVRVEVTAGGLDVDACSKCGLQFDS